MFWCTNCKAGWELDKVLLSVEPNPHSDSGEPTPVARCPLCKHLVVQYEFVRKES